MAGRYRDRFAALAAPAPPLQQIEATENSDR
jgi:hypothetical protein